MTEPGTLGYGGSNDDTSVSEGVVDLTVAERRAVDGSTQPDIRSRGTWRDDEPVQSGPLIDVREEQRHRNVLQSRLLTGLGVVFVSTLLLVMIGPATGFVTETFARDLAQMILPALLTFGGTIVGTLFNPPK